MLVRSEHLVIGDRGNMSLGGGVEGEASQPFLYIFFFILLLFEKSILFFLESRLLQGSQAGRQAGSDCRPCLPAPSAQQRAKGPEAAGKRCAPSELGVSAGCDSLPVLQVKAAATVSNCQPLSSTALAFFFSFCFYLFRTSPCHIIAVFPTPDADDDVAPVRVQRGLAWRDRNSPHHQPTRQLAFASSIWP